jgi:hypothetical protein
MSDHINEAWDAFEKESAQEDLNVTIAASKNFDELIGVIESVKRIKKNDGTVYSSDELIDTIQKVRSAEITAQFITREYGLREKASQLFATEQVMQATNLIDLQKKVDVIVAMMGQEIKSSRGEPISSADLKSSLEMVINQGYPLNLVTSTYGFREKAMELADYNKRIAA